VCGYYAASRGIDDVLAELAERAQAGIRRAKLIAPATTGDELVPWLAELSSARLPLTLSVDLYNSFATAADALPLLERLDELGLDFIEDPFRAGDLVSYAAVADRLSTPLAAGEDAVTTREWTDLIEHGVGILRADVTVTGGFSGFLDAAPGLGSAAAIVPHVFPAVHANLAATGTVGSVEVIERTTGAEPIHLLGVTDLGLHDGKAVLADDPGLALGIDWEAVARYTVGSARW
jgi:L-alanine-DL-glutamate epimerase-like enolase superfamily enzyme